MLALSSNETDPETADLSGVGIYHILFARPDVSALPPALSTRELAMYSRWLQLDGSRIQTLLEVHRNYLGHYAAYKAEHSRAVGDAFEALHVLGSMAGFTADNLRRSRIAEAAAEERLRAIEHEFFANLQRSLHLEHDDVGLQRVKAARQRQWLNSGVVNSQTREPGGCCSALIDLSWILSAMRNLDLSEPSVDRVMQEYERSLVGLLEVRQRAVWAYARAYEELTVEWQRRSRITGEEYPDVSDYRATLSIDELQNDARQAGTAIAELNRMTVDRLRRMLPPESAERVRRTYQRIAWRRIYSDSSWAAPWLVAASKLSGLTPQQRIEIEDVQSGYSSEYDALCEAMIKSVEVSPYPHCADTCVPTESWIAFNHRSNERKRTLGIRHDLNIRVWHRLRHLLTEEQAKLVGLAATPPNGPGKDEDFGV